MRKLFVCAFAFLCLTANVSAQTAKDIRKERQEIRKASKSELNEKATKTARKDAKKLKKEGWITVPGALPLEKQLDKSYMMQMEYDEDAASVTQSIMGAKNLISQSIGRTIIVMECYRVKTNKNKEVLHTMERWQKPQLSVQYRMSLKAKAKICRKNLISS